MTFLGIDPSNGLVYEKATFVGHGVWPTPFLMPAKIIGSLSKEITATTLEDTDGLLLFREDAFDPVSRIRRGRFYKANSNGQPESWQVTIHSATNERTGPVPIRGYSAYSIEKETSLFKNRSEQPLIILGRQESFSIWTMTNIEKTVYGQDLVTLRMRRTFGALPKINEVAIPSYGKEVVIEKINKLAEEIHRGGPESVIDRAREAVTAILSVFLNDSGKDLGDLNKKLKNLPEEKQKHVVQHAANIIGLFHARGKTAEQQKRDFRSITEQDAELAVKCVGTILCDLAWAEWL